MPVEDCQSDGKPGRRWGGSGKCYTYGPGTGRTRDDAEKLAARQGRAIHVDESRRDPGLIIVEER